MSEKREQWSSRFGLIMAAAGSAVGLGNIWRFPYITGKYGGAAFLVVYIVVALIIGMSVMLAELAIGRNAKLDAIGSLRKLGGNGWSVVGWMGFFCAFVILSYYAVIAGWAFAYIFEPFTNTFSMAQQGKAAEAFTSFIGNPVKALSFFFVAMAVTITVVYKGIAGGIEKSCKVLMPALFIILLVLIARSVTLSGSRAGLEYYLKPDLSKITAEAVLNAVGQSFYSLSLAMGIMITYGSYVGKEIYLPSTVRSVVVVDTLVAFLAGLVIFPAAFAFGVEPNAGPGLTFITLPAIFAKMPMGRAFCSAFFVLLFIAALTSMMSLLEVVVTYAIDQIGWSRPKAAIGMGLAITLLGIPSALSQGAMEINIGTMSLLDFFDYITNNVVMPIGGLLIAIFVGWRWAESAKNEITENGQLEFPLYNVWIWICRVFAPLAIGYVFIKGL